MSYRIPAQNIPVAGSQPMTQPWFQYFSKQYQNIGGQGAKIAAITVLASPFTYQAQSNGSLIISGGTVSAIAYSRDNQTFYSLPTAGIFPMFALDFIRVTYTVAPSMVFVP